MHTAKYHFKEIDVFATKDIIEKAQPLVDFCIGKVKMQHLINDYLLLMFIAVLRGEHWIIPSRWEKDKVLLSLKINRKINDIKVHPTKRKGFLLKLSKIKNSFNEVIFFDFYSDFAKEVVFKASQDFKNMLYRLVSKEDMGYVYEKTDNIR
jgi:hypothetical protein